MYGSGIWRLTFKLLVSWIIMLCTELDANQFFLSVTATGFCVMSLQIDHPIDLIYSAYLYFLYPLWSIVNSLVLNDYCNFWMCQTNTCLVMVLGLATRTKARFRSKREHIYILLRPLLQQWSWRYVRMQFAAVYQYLCLWFLLPLLYSTHWLPQVFS